MNFCRNCGAGIGRGSLCEKCSAAGIARQEAEHDFAHEISVMALVAASDPHLTAEQYRKALTGICNRAIAEKEALAGRVRASAQEQGREERTARPSGAQEPEQGAGSRPLTRIE